MTAVFKASALLLLAAPCAAMPGMEIAEGFAAKGNASGSVSLRGSSSTPGWLPYLPGLPAYIFRWGPKLAVMDARVRLGIDLADADPLWKEASELIRTSAYASAPGKKFMDLCQEGKYEEYTRQACAADTLGAIPVGGIPADAFFCGSTKSGINWQRSWWGGFAPPVKRVCDARVGTAYNATGICGKWTTKQLVLSFFYATPLWGVDPVTINAPAVHCLLGLGNCDIHYCQHCAGRCGPAQAELLP